jgi:uncharacterized membrane protein
MTPSLSVVSSLAAGPILSPWIVLPMAAVTLIVTAAHVVALQMAADPPLPARRRRIRTAAGVLMMFVTTFLAYALGVLDALPSPGSDPQGSRIFLLTWLSIASLLLIVVFLAVLDLGVTAREAALHRLKLRHELRRRLADDLLASRVGVGGTEQPAPSPLDRAPRR